MQVKNIFFVLFILGILLDLVLNQVLEYIDYRSRCKNNSVVPTELFGYIDSKLLKKTCSYENEHYFLFIPKHIASAILTFCLAIFGYYAFVYKLSFNLTQNLYIATFLFVILFSLPQEILFKPFSIYSEFHIEKKYGFSTTTVLRYILDELKSILLSCIIGIPLLCIVVFFLTHATSWWWLFASIVYLVFSVGIAVIYPIWIAPLFNKFSPLENAELKARLERLLERTDFSSEGIFVMDASKRSNHSNAYFTGFGKSKRVVLYDTLLNQLSSDEIESILGHELGHYKLHHIIKRLVVMIPLVFVSLFAVSKIIQMPQLYSAFNFSVSKDIVPSQLLLPGILLVQLVFEGYSLILSLVTNFTSCKDELAADKFAAELCGTSRHLRTALIKLHKENLSEIIVPKIYAMFNCNHPPLLERIYALKKVHPNPTSFSGKENNLQSGKNNKEN